MVVAVIKGGLGNQLFIFAASYSFANKYNLPLYVDKDTGFLFDKYKRVFEINKFNIDVKYLPVWKSILLKIIEKKWLPKFALQIFNKKSKIISINQSVFFDVFSTDNTLFRLEDYFQSDKYFSSISSELNAIVSSLLLPEKYSTLINLLQQSTTLVVHGRLRRAFASDGTKVVSDTLNAKQVPTEFFVNAVSKFLTHSLIHDIIIFSDDPQEFIKLFSDINLNIHAVDKVSNGNAVEELALMSHGKNFVISNSTFSWWGAYLSSFSDKKVLIPQLQYWESETPEYWETI